MREDQPASSRHSVGDGSGPGHLVWRHAVELDDFVKREGLDPFTIKMKSCANFHDGRPQAKAHEIYYALPQFLVSCV